MFHDCSLARDTSLSDFFLLLNSVTSAVTANSDDVFKKIEIIPRFHFHITEINSNHQSSFLLSLKVELMLLMAILNRLKSFKFYFLMFAIN